MAKYDKIRQFHLHPHTELEVIRPKNRQVDSREYVLKYVRMGKSPHNHRKLRNEVANIRFMDHPSIVGVSIYSNDSREER